MYPSKTKPLEQGFMTKNEKKQTTYIKNEKKQTTYYQITQKQRLQFRKNDMASGDG